MDNQTLFDATAPTVEVLDLIERDWRPHAQDIRDAIDAAIIACHEKHGTVDIGRMREFLPEWATGPQVGARYGGHISRGALEPTGEFTVMANKRTRNSNRPCRVYRLVKPLEDSK